MRDQTKKSTTANRKVVTREDTDEHMYDVGNNNQGQNQQHHQMEEDNDEIEAVEAVETESGHHQMTPYTELATKFNRILVALINIYEKYFQTSSVTNESTSTSNPQLLTSARLDECLTRLEKLNLNELTKCELFTLLLDMLDRLIELIFESKRDASDHLFALFNHTNLVIIQFYEFVNRMLNVFSEVPRLVDITSRFNSATSSSSSSSVSSSTKTPTSTREAKHAILGKALEILHVLITNKTGEQDEYTVSFCSLVASSFNFTSSICRLLVAAANKSKSDQELLSEKRIKIAFSILNELTSNNKLLFVDNNVKQLIFDILDRILKNNFQPMHLQLLSNTLRNDTADIENIIKSTSKVRELYRQLISIILNKQIADVVLNSLIVLIKLKYDSMFSILWPVSTLSSSSSSSSSGSNGSGGASRLTTAGSGSSQRPPLNTVTNMFEPFDLTLQVLDDSSQLYSSKLNAINFLLEFVKFEQVKIILENNDHYSNLFMFKLKLFLIDKSFDTSTKLPTIIILKIISIFNQLAVSSEKLARKLFYIVFNTRKFVENGSDENTSKKLKGILMANNRMAKSSGSSSRSATKPNSQNFDVFIDYFCKLTEIQTLSIDSRRFRIKNSPLSVCFLEYLLNLFKKNENKLDASDFEDQLKRMYKSLVDNLSCFMSILNHSGVLDVDDENTFDKLYFYNLAIIDSIFKLYASVDENQEATIEKLFQLLESKTWLSGGGDSNNRANSKDSGDACLVNYTYVFITIKCLIRFCFAVDDKPYDNLKQKLLIYIKGYQFMEILCSVIVKSNGLIYQLLAFELIFQLRDLSKNAATNGFKYDFPIERFIKTNMKLKETNSDVFKLTTTWNADYSQPSSPSCSTWQQHMSNTSQQQSMVARSSEFEHLIEMYELRLAQHSEQESHLMSVLNQYFAKSQLKDVENREMRGKLAVATQKCVDYKRELETTESRRAELESKLQSITKLHVDLEKSYQELHKQNTAQTTESASLAEQCKKLKYDLEQLRKENEETSKQLRSQFEHQVAEKNDVLAKLADLNVKLKDTEQLKARIESKVNDLNAELEAKLAEIEEKDTQLGIKNKELEQTRNEFQKLKSILAYVKNADI